MPPKDLVSHSVRGLFRGCELLDPVERTLAIIKPDGVAAGVASEIIDRCRELSMHVGGIRLIRCFQTVLLEKVTSSIHVTDSQDC